MDNLTPVDARIERLERLAGVDGAARGPAAEARGPEAEVTAEPSTVAPSDSPRESVSVAESAPHAPNADALDIQTIRRSWPNLLERLGERRQMILRANLESVTATAYDGATLELAFPPGRKFSVQKVQSKEEDLRKIFADVFGVSPRIVCVARDPLPRDALAEEEEETPTSKEDALAALRAARGPALALDFGRLAAMQQRETTNLVKMVELIDILVHVASPARPLVENGRV